MVDALLFVLKWGQRNVSAMLHRGPGSTPSYFRQCKKETKGRRVLPVNEIKWRISWNASSDRKDLQSVSKKGAVWIRGLRWPEAQNQFRSDPMEIEGDSKCQNKMTSRRHTRVECQGDCSRLSRQKVIEHEKDRWKFFVGWCFSSGFSLKGGEKKNCAAFTG